MVSSPLIFLLALVGFSSLAHCQVTTGIVDPEGPVYGTQIYPTSSKAAGRSSSKSGPAPTNAPVASPVASPPAASADPASATVDGSAIGDVQCATDLCVGAIVTADHVQYVMQSNGAQAPGWMAMGFGTGMVGSPMVVMWANNDGTVTLSQRQASAHSLPSVVSKPPRVATVSNNLSEPTGAQMKLAYSIPAGSDMKPNLIWAVGSDTPSSSDGATATFKQHTAFGKFTFDLTQTGNDPKVLGSPVLSLSQPVKLGGSGTTAAPKKVQKNSAESVILAHGIVLAIAYLVVMPAGALLARYLRTFSVTWFKGHWILQFGLTGPLVVIGAILAGTIARAGGPSISNTHTQVGILLFILYGCQVLLGGVIHWVKPKNAKGRPIQNYLHAVLGLTIIALGFFQVHTGYSHEWPNAVGRPAPMAINVIWYIWVFTVPLAYFGGLALLKRQYAQEREARAAPKMMTWDEMKGV